MPGKDLGGELKFSIVHPRGDLALFRSGEAPPRLSWSIIIPARDPTPSQEDLEVTRRLVEAGTLLGIIVQDHIIIGDGCYVSFKEKGFIN